MRLSSQISLSFWESNSILSDIDITIVGSGIVGLLTAYHLKLEEPKLKVAIVERGAMPYGASTRNAGFACFGSPSELMDDLNTHTMDEVMGLVEKRWKGLNKLRKILGDKNIDFYEWNGYEVFESKYEFERCLQSLSDLNENVSKIMRRTIVFGEASHKISSFGLTGFNHMIEIFGEGQLDTGKMMKALIELVQKQGCLLLNGLNVDNIEDNGNLVNIHTNSFVIKSKKVLLATNGFTADVFHGLDITPARAQVMVTSEIDGLSLKGNFHFDKGFYYFRNIGNRVLLGGGRNLDFKKEETREFGITDEVQAKLESLLKEKILKGKIYSIDHRWSGIMGLGSQKSTIVASLSKNVFCAVRMGGMGVAIASLVGEEAAEMLKKSI